MTTRFGAGILAVAASMAIASCATSEPPAAAARQGTFRTEVELNGRQVVPPSESRATGFAEVAITGGRQLFVRLIVADMDPSEAEIRIGRPGAADGGVVVRLQRDGQEVFLARRVELAPAHYEAVKSGNAYLSVSSRDYPRGEIRGQIPAH
jgi:hypothetical protein